MPGPISAPSPADNRSDGREPSVNGATHYEREAPAEVGRVGEPESQPLTAERRMDVGRIAGQQHSAEAVGPRDTGIQPAPTGCRATHTR
ncbi:hypothetical protein GCM10023147_25940 [Tsukamurella soli]|uniref:Uncharacterized protein n=1 Tax=Tsukamurella soli TaxID=644556 RepID=A0ABP8JQ18_9ACTN